MDDLGSSIHVKHMACEERIKMGRVIFTQYKNTKLSADCIMRYLILKQKFQNHFIEKQTVVGQNRTYLTTFVSPRVSVNLTLAL